jgi:hypothetical protein
MLFKLNPEKQNREWTPMDTNQAKPMQESRQRRRVRFSAPLWNAPNVAGMTEFGQAHRAFKKLFA